MFLSKHSLFLSLLLLITAASPSTGQSVAPSRVPSNDPTIDHISSKSWRLWAHLGHTQSQWSWDIQLISFYRSTDCSGQKLSSDGIPFDSGHANASWSPDWAFTGSGIWGGRPINDEIYIGMTFSNKEIIRCVEYTNASYSGKGVNEMRIEALNVDTTEWETVLTANNLNLEGSAVNRIPLVQINNPSSEPSLMPSTGCSDDCDFKFDLNFAPA
eukprot:CAMPEP_0194075204 /NCGR_PEP_ID=MMETSP0149-20130528/2226_1 /TAXON_ID=122233 /ORGANISM="Chaetoceros debilis, Strain MM31A-1" /LENGTH=213 /DNA_ID=CAMNT_0038755597 /DNA_START=25 /DNA_END=663 /DNA_ORIENTATION=+